MVEGPRRLKGTTVITPMGCVALARSAEGLVGVTLPKPDCEMAAYRLMEEIGAEFDPVEGDELLETVADLLRRFYGGEEVDFSGVELDWRVGTPFFRDVWRFVQKVPRGRTVTYGEVAAAIGRPRAARAVGMAMSRNPWPPIVPCHRVVGSDGGLGGFGGGLEMKKKMLEMEGAL